MNAHTNEPPDTAPRETAAHPRADMPRPDDDSELDARELVAKDGYAEKRVLVIYELAPNVRVAKTCKLLVRVK